MPALFLWIGAAIARVFSTRLGAWIAQAMFFLGLQWGVHEFAIEPLMAQIQGAMGQVGGPGIAWLAFFNLDRYISIILSAYATAAGKRAILQRRPA